MPIAESANMSRGTKRPLKVGLHIPHQTFLMDKIVPRWTDILTMARRAEEVGFDSLWLVDHLLAPKGAPIWRGGPPTPVEGEQRGCWECGSLLAALAAAVPRVELGTLVLCNGYRHPPLVAKIADAVEEISGGRLILGLGAGDAAWEHHAFGYPYDRRVGRFEEALQIIRPLLRGATVDFTGMYYQVEECASLPRGPRPGGPPLMIGALGHGQRMLRLVAQYADIWNGWLVHDRSSAEAVVPLRAAVDAACETHGRDPATLARSVAIRVAVLGRQGPTGEAITGTSEAIAAALRAFAVAGIAHVQVFLTPDTVEGVEAFAPVLDLLDCG